MRRRLLRRMMDQRGVAMITVLFIGATITIVASTAAFVTIQELRSSTDDRKAAAALSYAEAGVDRLLLSLRGGTYNWGNIRLAGCDAQHPPVRIQGQIGNGTFDAQLTVYNPNASTPSGKIPPGACAGRSDDPKIEQPFAITSTGRHPAARRVVRQELLIKASGLPVGIYSDRIDANGTGAMLNVSVVTPGNMTNRDKIGFTGEDPYYTLGDFYPGLSTTTPIPTAIHAVGNVTIKNQNEHPPSPNCTANERANPAQAVWDGSGTGTTLTSGCAGWGPDFPPTSRFTTADLARVTPRPALTEEDYNALKQVAKSSGYYCVQAGNNLSCSRQGGPFTTVSSTIENTHLGPLLSQPTFVAYFDYPAGGDPFGNSQEMKWHANVAPCSDDPATNRQAIVIVRNGSVHANAGSELTGALIIPEGGFDSNGNAVTHGTIIAKDMWIRGTMTFEMSECWVRNLPAPWLTVNPTRWAEVDR